ncbi:hypothetical protein SAMN05428945_7138 [Streptomyces sp. 2224.1]|uniref:DUF1453 domain-containing protein n=1 Tax=unclassified Streptomyces TaxID=2593676 RepID=UPI000883864B|nr:MULTISPECIES: DUF1453 domain-containing protein [unclassified Streptomyces]PBC85500.1 hypothetical protein BX261_5514 [Streptomyces sp. 2321.6]SDR13506.1 hypothetical protein SAMN05216511_1748 [Streptomyces sp. KS_16]SED70003.1 hypothetical protein SAMN05428940_5540 [Streptomyces sp. 2133.1]SEE11993.1 hypothetical protein SAMN05428954_1824 [Streptomyces sp. 2112.3]SEE34106.1 hypothetical protein SAMN05428945_7138 [Streptomyces sp. 2224.1]
MNDLLNIVVITAAVAWVFIRQFSARRVTSEGKKWWLIPVVLTVLALRQPGLLDPGHHAASAVLLGGEILIGLACGVGWAWTIRIWTDADGAVWSKGGWAAAGVWLCGMVLRLGLMGIAAAMGVHQGGAATMLSVAAMLLTRAGVTTWRAQALQQTYRVPVAG